MNLQDAITNLSEQIEHEEQSATVLEKQIADEQRASQQRIAGWQQQADAHHAAAQRMQQDKQAKQQQLAHDVKVAAERQQKEDDLEDTAKNIIGGLF